MTVSNRKSIVTEGAKVADKRRVRFTTATVKNPDTGKTELQVRAGTKHLGREIHAQGADEGNAMRALQAKVVEADQHDEFKRQYPKTVEVDW